MQKWKCAGLEETFHCFLCFREQLVSFGGSPGLECDDCWQRFPAWFLAVANWIARLGCCDDR